MIEALAAVVVVVVVVMIVVVVVWVFRSIRRSSVNRASIFL